MIDVATRSALRLMPWLISHSGWATRAWGWISGPRAAQGCLIGRALGGAQPARGLPPDPAKEQRLEGAARGDERAHTDAVARASSVRVARTRHARVRVHDVSGRYIVKSLSPHDNSAIVTILVGNRLYVK